MANPALPCACVPHVNLCCGGTKQGITVIQPGCQTLPDGTVVNNPAFVGSVGKSYWTYKFMTDCGCQTRPINSLGIPVCCAVTTDQAAVSERIDGCGEFVRVPFTVVAADPVLGKAPPGFVWIKAKPRGRFGTGVCVEYRLELTGDFPTARECIKVKAGDRVLPFGHGYFKVPGCSPQGQLAMNVCCARRIADNQLTLEYEIGVDNVGRAPLDQVRYQDSISVPTTFILGTIRVTPNTLAVDTSVPGLIQIRGDLGRLRPGQHQRVRYTISVANILAPGLYATSNAVTAASTGTQVAGSCRETVEAVQLTAFKCCHADGSIVTYETAVAGISPSPATVVDIADHLILPAGVTVSFISFSDCTATFTHTETPVPMHVPVSGPATIAIRCRGAIVPPSATVHKQITFQMLASSIFEAVHIANSIDEVRLANLSAQIFLGVVPPLPEQAVNTVSLELESQSPCQPSAQEADESGTCDF